MESTAASLPLFLQPDVKFPAVDDCLGSPLLKEGTPALDRPPWSRTSGPLPTVGLCLLNSCWRRPTQWAFGRRGRHSHRWAERERGGHRRHRKAINKTWFFFSRAQLSPTDIVRPPTNTSKTISRFFASGPSLVLPLSG